MPPASSTQYQSQYNSYSTPNHQYITTITAHGTSHQRSGSSCSPQPHSISVHRQPAAFAASVRASQSTAPDSIRHHTPPRLSARSARMGHVRIDRMRQYTKARHHAVTGDRPRQASRKTQDIVEETNTHEHIQSHVILTSEGTISIYDVKPLKHPISERNFTGNENTNTRHNQKCNQLVTAWNNRLSSSFFLRRINSVRQSFR